MLTGFYLKQMTSTKTKYFVQSLNLKKMQEYNRSIDMFSELPQKLQEKSQSSLKLQKNSRSIFCNKYFKTFKTLKLTLVESIFTEYNSIYPSYVSSCGCNPWSFPKCLRRRLFVNIMYVNIHLNIKAS